MKSNFFYSKSTGLYVSRDPLAIDARVKEAADKLDINIDWNDEGIINNIDYDNAKKLILGLSAKILSPIEYWTVFNDAIQADDNEMLRELCSNKYAEWLDRVYFNEGFFIDNPKIIGKYKYDGRKEKSKYPDGTPGWFNPENNIDYALGVPIRVEIFREKFATSWKYWAPSLGLQTSPIGITAPIRGYVTSVGKPSYDLGIPVDSRQPRLMIRECRYEPLTSVIDAKILARADSIDNSFVSFIEEYGELFAESKDSLVYQMREMFFNKLGETALKKDISKAIDKICKVKDKKLKFDDFASFIMNSRESLKDAIDENKDIVFVMGHKNPDTDAVVSSLFEAYRNHLIDDNSIYVPIVQSEKIPDEVVYLLGKISDEILLSKDQLYERAKTMGLARWISVDQNREPGIQKYFISIIDHHIVSESAKNRDIPKTLEMLGSTAALITRKYLGMGLEFDRKMASILYGATLMDTENRVEHKMTPKDVRLMDYLKEQSGIKDDNESYGKLMSHLLNTDDAGILFGRDYKEDWGFGFAIAKIKNGFSANGRLIKESLVSRLYEMAVQNNTNKNLPLTLLKITDYKEDNETVNRERLYFILNNATKKFMRTLRDTLEGIIRFEFPGESIEVGNDHIDFWGSGLQLSRKKTAPVLEPISAAFNRYFYSSSIRRWVKRDFQRKTGIIEGEYSTDEEGRINYITYGEAKKLAEKQGFEMLSLSEYWKVLDDAKRINDVQMIESLQGSNFVEFLDSKIANGFLVDHDREKRKVDVPTGNPGLIHPDDIDPETGLPTIVRPPNEYGNPELWRYWQPDADLVILCRSYIFLLEQPCLDGKFHPGESFSNLGLRPIVEKVVEPEINIQWDKDYLTVKIFEEGDTKQWKWPKRIWDT